MTKKHTTAKVPELHRIVLNYLEAREAGCDLDRQALLQEHPDLAAELGSFFADYDRVAHLADSWDGDSLVSISQPGQSAAPGPKKRDESPTIARDEHAAPAAPASMGCFGDYELLEEIARGGMGVVYKARQQSLGRVVALKMVLRGRSASALDLRRFRIEAEAAAQIEHPNIVPIYEVGEVDGQPYFSMKLIDGGGLDRHLDRLGKDPRATACLLARVARAVHHAHERGILHRDLKPANILLDAHGEPHVTDFGLAKSVWNLKEAGDDPTAADSAKAADGELTQAGSIIGTPNYMAPEQADPRRGDVTTAADVYGLGAVLYAVLTGHPPFRGETMIDVLMMVVEQPPALPRCCNPRVDRDLEAVCLKCLNKQPHQRYLSALALAEDLERWLANEPVAARPAGAWGRVVKWARRRPAAAALVGVCLAAALTLAGGGLWYNAQLQTALQAATAGREEAQREHRRAESNFRRAFDTVDRMVRHLDREDLTHSPALDELRQAVLLDALGCYQELLKEKSDDPGVPYETGRAARRAGDIERLLGRQEAALEAYDQAQALLGRLVDDFPERASYRRELGCTHDSRGRLLQALGKLDEAEQSFNKAVARRRDLTEQFRNDPDYQRELAETLQRLGNLLRDTGRPEEAETVLREALDLCAGLVKEFPDERGYRQELASSQNNLGKFLGESGKGKDAEQQYRQALSLCEQLLAEAPASPEYRLDLARTQMNLGNLLWATSRRNSNDERSQQAEKTLRDARTLCVKLADEFRNVPDYRQELARSHTNLGLLFAEERRKDEAEEAYRQALAIREQLVAEWPTVPSYQQELARTQMYLGRLWRQTPERRADADKVLQQALTRQRQLAQSYPSVPVYKHDLGNGLINLGKFLHDQGDLEQARQHFQEAIELQRAALEPNPRQPGFRRALFRAYDGLSDTLFQMKDHAGLARTAEEIAVGILGGPEGQYHAARYLARAALATGSDTQLSAEQKQAAVQSYGDRAVEFLREALRKGFKDFARLKNDGQLRALRGRDDFKALLARLPVTGG
jgi:tetratricopeptide (TPR) repeat protein/tRNA A-37 threonylcarbamoyl transferase component Bud32